MWRAEGKAARGSGRCLVTRLGYVVVPGGVRGGGLEGIGGDWRVILDDIRCTAVLGGMSRLELGNIAREM
jgi:hypothetical protein